MLVQHQVNLRGAKKHHDTMRHMMATSSHVLSSICRRCTQMGIWRSDSGLWEQVPHFLVACLVLNTNFEAVNFNEGVLPGPTPPTRFGAPCRWCAISRSSLTCILPF